MKALSFLASSLFLFVGILIIYFHFKYHFGGAEYYKVKSEILSEQYKEEKLKSLVAEYQRKELLNHVASILPHSLYKQLPQETGYFVRNLASVVLKPTAVKVDILGAKTLFSEGQKAFSLKDYSNSIRLFENLVNKYPDSIYVIKAHYLLAEALVLSGDEDRAVEVVDKMVTFFPEDELTGFSLLRIGQVYENEGRREDALDIYDLVRSKYSGSTLRAEAAKFKRRVVR